MPIKTHHKLNKNDEMFVEGLIMYQNNIYFQTQSAWLMMANDKKIVFFPSIIKLLWNI